MSDNNDKEDNLTVSRVYDTLKSPTFLKDLYWDILSHIKEKNTYKLMRGIAEGLIDQNLEVLKDLADKSDNVRRKKIVAEICAMSYAIDSVFSKILYIKLEKAYKEQVLNIIQQLKNEGKLPLHVLSKFKLQGEASETSETEVSSQNSVMKNNSADSKKEEKKSTFRLGRRKRTVNVMKNVKKANPKEILEDIKKVNSMKGTDIDQNNAGSSKENLPKKKLGGRIKEFPKKKSPSPVTSTPSKIVNEEKIPSKTPVDNIAEDSASQKLKDFLQSDKEGEVSDAESEISVGGISLASISSVHTSDLSSFDDQISLSSDDEEGKKKKVPLKEVLKRFSVSNNSKLQNSDTKSSEESESKEKPVEVVENKNKKKEVSKDDAAVKSTSKTTSFESSNGGLSKRMRKPNSKYSSEAILCTVLKVKDRKKSISSVSNKRDKTSNDELSPDKKKPKLDDDITADVFTITQSISNEGSATTTNNCDMKSPVKSPVPETSQELYKPFSVTRPLSSRRSDPVILFST